MSTDREQTCDEQEKPFASLEAALAKEQEGGLFSAFLALSDKHSLMERIQILEFMIERFQDHAQLLRSAAADDEPTFYGKRNLPKCRDSVSAMSSICIEFQHAPRFAQNILWHLDAEFRRLLGASDAGVPSPDDADKLISMFDEKLRESRFMPVRIVANPSGRKAIVVGRTEADISTWQTQHEFTITEQEVVAEIDERPFRNLEKLRASRYPALWWVSPLFDECPHRGITFGLFEPIRIALGLEQVPPHCVIYSAYDKPPESSIEPWGAFYKGPLSICTIIGLGADEENHLDEKMFVGLSGLYERFLNTVSQESLLQYRFLLTLMKSLLLGRLDVASSMQQKVLAVMASAIFAAISVLGDLVGTYLKKEWFEVDPDTVFG